MAKRRVQIMETIGRAKAGKLSVRKLIDGSWEAKFTCLTKDLKRINAEATGDNYIQCVTRLEDWLNANTTM